MGWFRLEVTGAPGAGQNLNFWFAVPVHVYCTIGTPSLRELAVTSAHLPECTAFTETAAGSGSVTTPGAATN